MAEEWPKTMLLSEMIVYLITLVLTVLAILMNTAFAYCFYVKYYGPVEDLNYGLLKPPEPAKPAPPTAATTNAMTPQQPKSQMQMQTAVAKTVEVIKTAEEPK
ncbi:hypothetical protein M3Y94_01023600 [Aphelenchoides besseyi]|nr:hypothetical protein M3Y94_01023600 [Aphelenchoides besseyi]KAI6223835.1 hypothetical protein M3Y95_00818600 [Aphelenchoides besseyi]